MIYKDSKQITGVYKGSTLITSIYRGTRLVYQYVRSCFGRGYWINDKPWLNGDGWKNNN